MNLEEMKCIADARNKDYWNEVAKQEGDVDTKFLSMVITNWDKLMAVVEAAKILWKEEGNNEAIWSNLEEALEELEKEP